MHVEESSLFLVCFLLWAICRKKMTPTQTNPLFEGGLQVYGGGRLCICPSLKLIAYCGEIARIPQVYWKMYANWEEELRESLKTGAFHQIKYMTQTTMCMSFGGMWLFFYPLQMRWLCRVQALVRRWLARTHAARVRKAVAVAQGLHPRLGQKSPLQMLPEHILALCLN